MFFCHFFLPKGRAVKNVSWSCFIQWQSLIRLNFNFLKNELWNLAATLCTLQSTFTIFPGSMMGSVPVGDEVTILEHPPLLSPPGLPPAGLDLPHGGPPHPPFDALFPPPFMPPAPFMPPEHPGGLGMPPMYMPPMPPPPPSGLMADHRPPPLGMISSANFDVDFRRELSVEPPPRRYGRDSSPPKRYPSPGGSERSARSDRSDMNHYDDYYR